MSTAAPGIRRSRLAQSLRARIGAGRRLGQSSRLLWLGIVIISIAVFVAVFGPFLAPYDPVAVVLRERLLPPSPEHWLGTDQLGRDVLSRILHAGRVTISIALVAMILSAGLGITIGVVSGYFGGRLDIILQRLVDVQLAFPTILLAITIVAVLGSSVPILIFVFVLAGWARYVRVIRSQTLVVRETQYV